MRKLSLLLILTLMLVLGTFLLVSPTAYAAASTSHSVDAHAHAITPQASGGGCGSWQYTYYGSGSIAALGCISYGWPNLNLSGEVRFYALPQVISCTADLILYTTSQQPYSVQQRDCTNDANNWAGESFGFTYNVLAGSYYSEMFVRLEYSNHTISSVGSDSPVQHL